MRVIGLDLGNRTVGIAVSDATGLIARPIGTFRIPEQDLKAAAEIVVRAIEDHKADKIVLGLPLNMNGTTGPQAEYCLRFRDMLIKATGLETIMIDERLTTKQADRTLLEADLSRRKRKQKVDKLAAAIILQTYLDGKDKNG